MIIIELPPGMNRAGEVAPDIELTGDGKLTITASKRTAQRVVAYKVEIAAPTVQRIEELLEKRRKAKGNV